MATMAELVNQSKAQSQQRLTFVKSSSQLNISAEVDLRSSEFHSLRVNVKKFPLVFAAGASEDGPIIIDYNFDRLGRIECGFVPKVVVLSGINAAKAAKANAAKSSAITAWVGTKAFKVLEITASDVSSNELQELLYKAVSKAYGKPDSKSSNPAYYMDAPYIIDACTFDNSAILGFKNIKYRQRYNFNASTHSLTLEGEMVPIVDTPAATAITAGSVLDEGNRGPTQGGFNGRQFNVADAWRDFGAPNSEANNPAIMLMLNVEEALRCYLQEILKGVHKVIYPGKAVTPPNMIHAAIEANMAAKELKAKDFSVVDFLKWQNKKLHIKAAEQTKIVDGEAYGAEEFGHVEVPRDISTWFIPLRTSSQVLKASKDEKLAGVPKAFKKETRQRIQAMLQAVGGPTSGKSKATDPHKFVINADEPDKDMCKRCSRSGAHPIHKVK